MENGTTKNAARDSASTSTLVLLTQKNGIISFSLVLSVKLGEDKFLLWEQQVSTTIRGHKLHKYITEDTPHWFETEADKIGGKTSDSFLEWDQ